MTPVEHHHLCFPLQFERSLLQELEQGRYPLVAAVESRSVAAAVSLPSRHVCAEAVCSAAQSHRSQSYWGPRPASRPWSSR